MPSKSNLGEANRVQRCLICARHNKYTIICYPQSTDPLPCGTPPDSGGEFLVCSCATCDLPLLVLSKLISFIFALCSFHFDHVRFRLSTLTAFAFRNPRGATCSCTTRDKMLLMLSKLLTLTRNFNFVEVRLRSLQ